MEPRETHQATIAKPSKLTIASEVFPGGGRTRASLSFGVLPLHRLPQVLPTLLHRNYVNKAMQPFVRARVRYVECNDQTFPFSVPQQMDIQMPKRLQSP